MSNDETFISEDMITGTFYSLEGAARFLDLSVRTVEKHVYETKKLGGVVWNGRLIFEASELERFKATPRPPGNPTNRSRRANKPD